MGKVIAPAIAGAIAAAMGYAIAGAMARRIGASDGQANIWGSTPYPPRANATPVRLWLGLTGFVLRPICIKARVGNARETPRGIR